jgi:hypothetical protein
MHWVKRMLDWLEPTPTVEVKPTPALVGVVKADAIAELCMPTGDVQLDGIHVALIDLIQSGLIECVRDDAGNLRFGTTPAGKQRVQEILGELRERDERRESLRAALAG